MINTSFISTPVTHAIGLALIHSIWQGILIGFLAGIFLVFIKNERPEIKYNIAISAMFFMFITFVVTFIISFYNTHHTSQIITQTAKVQVFNSTQSIIPITPNAFTILLINVEPFLPIITMIWLVGVLAHILQISKDLLRVHYLKTRNIKSVNPELAKVFNLVANQMRILKNFHVFESSKVRIPMVIGYLKPVILLPAGVFTGFSTKQIESIIAHELAHILRNDYLINIIISFIKPVFFYHPVFWWFVSIIEQEREKCCDDRAITGVIVNSCGSKSVSIS